MYDYPLHQNKFNWRSLEPMNDLCSDEYLRSHYDLYLKSEYIKDEHGEQHRYYRLHANKPHNIEQALAYDIKCPRCHKETLKQVGRCKDLYTLGLYECPVCDKKNRR